MHGRRRGQRDLPRQLGDVAQEHEFVERERLRTADLALGIRRREIDLVTAVIAELERGRLDLEALRTLDEPPPIGAAAEFSVGDHLQADLFLQGDHVADALVLQRGELHIVHLLGGVPAEGLPQGAWTQQAADMIGTKWRAALS